jgi:hypothetical protein
LLLWFGLLLLWFGLLLLLLLLTIASLLCVGDAVRDLVTQGLIKHVPGTGPKILPSPVILHNLLTARRINHKKQIRANKAAKIKEQQERLQRAIETNPM